MHATQLYYFETTLPNLKLKSRPKQLLGSLPLDILAPSESVFELSSLWLKVHYHVIAILHFNPFFHL